jgi:hypothetical protein
MSSHQENVMNFVDFSKAVAQQFKTMLTQGTLYRSMVEKDAIWSNYLAAFPEGTNPMYKERTEHDCQCCRSFIRTVGGLVTIVNGELVSIWDVEIGGYYQVVADALAILVKSYSIDNVFLHTEKTAGVTKNLQQLLSGDIITWNHFFVNLPDAVVAKGDDIGPKLADTRSTMDVLLRSLREITPDSLSTVLELISQNSLYRGEEHKFAVESFQKLKKDFAKVSGVRKQERFAWERAKTVPVSVSRIRSTVIGTLLVDLSEDKDLEYAVKAFETKVAPTNYKRPTSLVTKAMIAKAQATIEELGFTSALERRYAVAEDITVQNTIFVDRKTKKAMNVFEELSASIPEKVKNFDRVEEVSIEKFLSDILPRAESISVMFENRHASNLVSLIAPVDPTAKGMFKWGNNFSWSYTGELADSIKERVKRAGGKVDGDFRASLSWYNYDDLDLWLYEPNGNAIYYGRRHSEVSGGQLDVDMNAGGGAPGHGSRTAVENIVYPDRKKMREGTYKLVVNNFRRMESNDVGFEVEMEFDGVVYSFAYSRPLRDKEEVVVAQFKYTHKGGLEILNSLPSSQTSKTVWGITTQTFQKVNVVMLSPNHWDGQPVGNKHYFFMLDGCLNDGTARGFFNEFLSADLEPHRKTMEMVGSKMRAEESNRQLSGLGFSSTQRAELLVQVNGSLSRTVKILF